MADNKQIAEDVLAAVGGKENVSSVTHCMTRLRFTLKDSGVPDTAKVKKIKGVIGVQESGGQYQVIVGQNVPKVYDEVCNMGGFTKREAIKENLDAPKEKLTPKLVGQKILNYLSGSMVPLIPAFMAGGLFKCFACILGPTMLNVISDTSDLYVFLNMVYNASFYFIPIYLGYSAAKQIGVTPMLGALLGGILIEPTFMQLAKDGASFSVFGIPCTPEVYSQTVLPILLSVAGMSVVEKFFRRHVPDALATVFVPLLTMIVATPFALCLFGPIGQWCGTAIAAVLNAAGNAGGVATILAAGVLSALWLPVIITGMHGPIVMLAFANLMAVGSDSFILVATNLRVWGIYAIWLASAIKLRDKQEKSNAFSYFIANFVGGVGEPGIYGLMLRYRRLFKIQFVTSFIAGILGAVLHVTLYMPSNSTFLGIVSYIGEDPMNFICAAGVAVVTFVAAFILVMLFGFTEDELENGPVSERQ